MSTIDKELSKISNAETADQCFAAFLYGVSRIAGEEAYKLYAIVLKLLRECINAQILEQLKFAVSVDIPIEEGFIQKLEQMEKIPFCENHSPYYIPLISNYFITKYIPKQQPALEQHLAMQIIEDYFAWLIKNGFTKIHIRPCEGKNVIENKIF